MTYNHLQEACSSDTVEGNSCLEFGLPIHCLASPFLPPWLHFKICAPSWFGRYLPYHPQLHPQPNSSQPCHPANVLQLGSLALSAAASVGIRDALQVAKAEVHRWTDLVMENPPQNHGIFGGNFGIGIRKLHDLCCLLKPATF